MPRLLPCGVNLELSKESHNVHVRDGLPDVCRIRAVCGLDRVCQYYDSRAGFSRVVGWGSSVGLLRVIVDELGFIWTIPWDVCRLGRGRAVCHNRFPLRWACHEICRATELLLGFRFCHGYQQGDELGCPTHRRELVHDLKSVIEVTSTEQVLCPGRFGREQLSRQVLRGCRVLVVVDHV